VRTHDEQSVTAHQLSRVVLWMTGTVLSFCVMAVAIRGLAGNLSVFEILVIRNALSLVILLGLVAVRPGLRKSLRPEQLGMHLARSFSHFGGQYLWTLSLTLLPLAVVFTLEFVAPVFVVILAAIFLGERMTVGRIIVVVFGFAGALIILRPGLEAFQPAALIVLLATLFYATANVLTKKMTGNTSIFAIVFWMNLMQLPMGLAGSDLSFPLRLEPWQWLSVIGVGVAGLTSHYCMANAFRWGDASVVTPLDFMRIPLIALVGWWFFRETVDVWVFVGGLIILAGILWNLRAETRPRPPEPPVMH
jgi:drug/metabolite transporter (DMT)-like permease